MSQAAIDPMPSGPQATVLDASSDVVSLRNFVVDEDRANLGSDLWKTIDKSSFIHAQREALEAFNIAKALRLSEQSTAVEQRRATNPAVGPVASTSSVAGPSQAPLDKSPEGAGHHAASSSSRRRPSQSQAVPIPRKDAPQPPLSNDEAAARSLARSWQVDGMQTSLLENRGRLPSTTSSAATSRPKTSAGANIASPSTSIYAPQSQSYTPNHEKRPSISKASTSQNVSLSTLTPSTVSHHAQSNVNVVPSSSHPHHNSAHHPRSHSHSVSYSHSRSTSQPQGHPQPQQSRVDPRPILKRDPATVDGSYASTSPPSSSRPHPTRSSSVLPSATTDSNQQKRRKASVSISLASNSASVSSTPSTQAPYPYSTSNYPYFHPYNTTNGNSNPTASNGAVTPPSGTSQASVQAQAHQTQAAQPVIAPDMSESKKQSSSSSASSKEIQAGLMINPANAGSTSISAPSSRPSSKETSPQVSMAALPSSGTSSASAQAAAAERENQRSRSSSRRRASMVQSPGTTLAQIHPPVQVPVQAPIQAQPQLSTTPAPQQQQQHAQGPRDIFAPTRFACFKCGNAVHSGSHAQPTQALTSPDPFSHPFASCLHLTCPNPSCGTTHCRGCLKAVKCRESVNENDALALVVVSTSPSKHANPLKPTPASCGGGPGCHLWTCCQNVRLIGIWEALRAFDAVFAAEAGFAVGGTDAKDFQHQALGRQHREAYVKLLISKADKSMRRFEDALVRTMRAVGSWLQPSCASFDTGDDDGCDEEDEDDEEERRCNKRQAHEKQLASLFRSSYLLEVFHAFLSNNKPRDWIAHSETYLAILEMMRRMLDSGLGALLTETPGFSLSVGGSVSAPVSAVYTPFATPSGSSSSSASSSPSSSHQQPPLSLYDLIKQLEKHRSPLMNLASRMQFSATVDKVNNLCDAISYLLLQQMVG